jgi:hypothetical protein
MLKRWMYIPPTVIIFLFFFCVYAFTMSGVILYGDEVEKYRVAQSIVDRREFSFRPTAHRNEIGADGRTYSIYELGQTVFQVPLYALARIVQTFFPQPDVNQIGFLIVGFLNPLLTALTCVLFFKTCQVLSYSFRTTLFLTLVFGLATIVWPYSRSYTREPLLTLLLLASFYAAWRFRQTNRWEWILATGIAVGYLTFTKLIQGTAVVVFLIYILFLVYQECRRSQKDTRAIVFTSARASALFLLPVLVLLLVQGLYALSRFGTFYSGIGGTKYNPIDWILFLLPQSEPNVAIIGLLLSPAKSVFLYSLPALLFPILWFKFFEQKRDAALVMLTLVLVALGTAMSRPDWDGGTWWGPRYLVQITPFLILPLGVFETMRAPARRLVAIFLALVSLGGLFVSAVGAFTSERDYLDIVGQGTHLAGQIDFLQHGFFDSLVLYWLPEGIQINPYGIVLLGIVTLTGVWIARAFWSHTSVPTYSWRAGWSVLGVALTVQVFALIVWIVIPYDQVQARKADTLFHAGELFAADGRVCEAVASYLLAIERGTDYQAHAYARVEELLPRAQGQTLAAEIFGDEIEAPTIVTVEEDTHITVSGSASLKISAPQSAGNVIARVQAIPLSALPDTRYELSGWIRAENVYGQGYGSITVSEDNGRFEHIRSTDLIKWDETLGWSYFQRTFTTLPTTRRLFIAAWLWKTPGTVWVDDLRLAQITESNPPSVSLQPCKCFPNCGAQAPGRAVGPYP